MATVRLDLAAAVDSGQQGTTTRPLDGGVLSLGRAHTPARGRGTAPLLPSGHHGRCAAALGSIGRRQEEREEE
jgi:hypothetical protein